MLPTKYELVSVYLIFLRSYQAISEKRNGSTSFHISPEAVSYYTIDQNLYVCKAGNGRGSLSSVVSYENAVRLEGHQRN